MLKTTGVSEKHLSPSGRHLQATDAVVQLSAYSRSSRKEKPRQSLAKTSWGPWRMGGWALGAGRACSESVGRPHWMECAHPSGLTVLPGVQGWELCLPRAASLWEPWGAPKHDVGTRCPERDNPPRSTSRVNWRACGETHSRGDVVMATVSPHPHVGGTLL